MTRREADRIDAVIMRTEFSGVVHVVRGDVVFARAAGLADRARGIANTLDTRFAVASGTKALTAMAVLSFVAEGRFPLDAPARGLLGPAADVVTPEVTIRQLLSHTSGIGDYLDEDEVPDIETHFLEIPADRLAAPLDFLPLLRGRPARFAPGTGVSYCNAGYVILALLLEAVSGRSYPDVVTRRVCEPAGLQATALLRLDDLPPSAAVGYLPRQGWVDNRALVPVRGGGDGGAYSTAEDIGRLWKAFFGGRIVPQDLVAEAVRPQHDVREGAQAFGLGFWLDRERKRVRLEGQDPGISFASTFEPATGCLATIVSNTTYGAWPVAREVADAGTLAP